MAGNACGGTGKNQLSFIIENLKNLLPALSKEKENISDGLKNAGLNYSEDQLVERPKMPPPIFGRQTSECKKIGAAAGKVWASRIGSKERMTCANNEAQTYSIILPNNIHSCKTLFKNMD